MNLESPPIRNGILAGIAGVIVSLLFYVTNVNMFFSISSWIVIVVYIFFMVKSAREARSQVESFDFREAFQATFLVYVVGSLLNVIFYYVLMNFMDPELVEMQKEVAIDAVERMGGMLSEDQLEAMVSEIQNQDMRFTLGRALYTLAFSLVFPGGLIAVIVSAIMKDSKKEY